MYFIEKFLKIFYKKSSTQKYQPQNIEVCQHVFMPIDSSGEYLACSKCGKLMKNELK